MITDIVPLTISATTMFVQVQSGELLVGESRMLYAVHSTGTGLRLGLQRSKSVWIFAKSLILSPIRFSHILQSCVSKGISSRHGDSWPQFRKQNVSHGGSLVNWNTNPEGESLQDGMKAEVAAFPSTGTVTTIVVPC